jgi:hypothetical protein
MWSRTVCTSWNYVGCGPEQFQMCQQWKNWLLHCRNLLSSYVLIWSGCLQHHELLSYQMVLFKIDIFWKLMIWHWWQLPRFLWNQFSKKRLTLRNDGAASSGGQGKLTYSMYFLCPPLEARLSISTFHSLFTCARKLLFVIYILLVICWSLKEISQFQALINIVLNVY